MTAKRRARMVELLDGLTEGPGVRPSALPGVRLMRADQDIARTPVLYDPGLVFVVQGWKRGYVAGQSFRYDPDRYLVLTVPMPFSCETHPPGPGRSMLGVSIRVDPAVLGELLVRTAGSRGPAPDPAPRSVGAAPITDALEDALLRLLEALAEPTDRDVLGPQVVREIVYRVLRGPRGDALRALAANGSRLAQVGRVLHRLHVDFARPVDVASLADDAAMSESTFHRHFRAVTSSTPLQYVKAIRLHKAREGMVAEGLGAAEAALRVGYDSPSQFSREFKRFFGRPPAAEAARMRELLGGG